MHVLLRKACKSCSCIFIFHYTPSQPVSKNQGETFIYNSLYNLYMRREAILQREVVNSNCSHMTKKPLTICDISPKWSERLLTGRKTIPIPLSLKWLRWYFELDSPAKCVIGEAYNYSSSYEYECKECNRLGWSFGKSFILRSRTRLENDVNQFVQHWNAKHLH